MLKMADACADSSKQTRFHEMHVQRHNNVSILYADIVNFTPLSERLSASDLVKTLNELFGRFDQIAQVRFFCKEGQRRFLVSILWSTVRLRRPSPPFTRFYLPRSMGNMVHFRAIKWNTTLKLVVLEGGSNKTLI